MFTRPKSGKYSPVFLKEIKPGCEFYLPNLNVKLKPLKIKCMKGGVFNESK